MTRETKTRRWEPWPVCITAFFAVAITGCVVFVIFCSRHPADLVAADYYEREIRYQSQMESTRRAQEEGGASVSYHAGARNIVIALPAAQAHSSINGTVQLYRPSAANLDRRIALQPDSAGIQKIDAASLSPGLWKVRVSWRAHRQDYFMDQAIVITARNS